MRPKPPSHQARDEQRTQAAAEARERAIQQQLDKRRNAVYNANIVDEKGIDAELLEKMGWQEIFEQRGWLKLAERPPPANYALVRDFYFHLNQDTLRTRKYVEVRGAVVEVSPASINNYFGAPTIEGDHFGWPTEVEDMPEEFILKNLCGPDHEKARQITQLKELSYEAHIWNLFSSFSICPVGRRSGFTKTRIKTLFALQNGLDIDLGAVIFHQIYKHGKGNKKLSLIFPSLITGLCRAEGVQIEVEGEPLSVLTSLTFQAINYIRSQRQMPKLLTAEKQAQADRRASRAAGRSSQASSASGSSSRPSSSARQSTDVPPDVTAMFQQCMAAQQEMLAAQRELIAASARNRAEDQEIIAQLQVTCAQLAERVESLNKKIMEGQQYARRNLRDD